MPTYVYECQKCGGVFEADQRIIEDPLTHCQLCPDGNVKRVIQPTAVMFKGSGFYVNDVAKATPAPAEKKVEAPAAEMPAPAPAAPEKSAE